MAFSFHSCSKNHETVVITEDLFCKLQDIFNGTFIGTSRPCDQVGHIENYWFTYYDTDSLVIKDEIYNMKGKYRLNPILNKNTSTNGFYHFKKFLSEMEKYGVKCISSKNILQDREHHVVFEDIPCKNSTRIHFYVDRISLQEFPIFDNVDLSEVESVSFTLFPFIKDTFSIAEMLLPGTYWAYEFYKKSPD